MNELVELEVIGRRCGRVRRVTMERRRADLVLQLAHDGAWPEFHFRYHPFEAPGMTWLAIVGLAVGFLGKLKASWEPIVIGLAAVLLLSLVAFTPKWERPVLGLIGIVCFAAGVVFSKKYLE